MMSNSIGLAPLALVGRLASLLAPGAARARRLAVSAGPTATGEAGADGRHLGAESERLEQVTAYARGGYFHVVCTMSPFPFVDEMKVH
ncbi:hypothetical protein [Burkholderia gladioli]|uniref:Uncharacterized protein n=2 Tax=Burkholderia gladioli TaxID=28095 RepID=A0AB38U134_BURGA|nr:hypothetical protein [Burkholderia gladioli]UWX73674.1 hypothetical protein NYZ96_19180 [Burkholderia gladioli]